LFNAAYKNDLSAGAHVLEVPQYGCADVIDKWCQDESQPLINNYKAAIPVNFHMDLKKGGNPWNVTIRAHEQFELPEQLADSDYIYNLDDVVLYPTKQELYDKLRKITPSEIFAKCMADYEDPEVNTSSKLTVSSAPPATTSTSAVGPVTAVASPRPVAATTIAPARATSPAVAPAFNIPKAGGGSKPAPVAAPKAAAPEEDNVPFDDDADAPRPPVPTTGVSIEQAKAFLKQN
jgi:hypothetical protein